MILCIYLMRRKKRQWFKKVVVRMDKKQTTIRLTIRTPGEMADWVKEEARREGKSMNQYILKILNLWRKSRH